MCNSFDQSESMWELSPQLVFSEVRQGLHSMQIGVDYLQVLCEIEEMCQFISILTLRFYRVQGVGISWGKGQRVDSRQT